MMPNNAIVITIGMPVYNGSKYVRKALDSLLKQTFNSFELIISDNASTDDTQAICKEYARRDSRIRYVLQRENMGALANFQFLLNQAQGEFFMWAAADDRWDERWLESLYAGVLGERGVAGFGELVHIDKHGTALSHPANGAKLKYEGNRFRRKLSYYLAYEGLGKANLFYAIYPLKILRSIDLQSYNFDYQILFSLIDQITYVQIQGVCFYKRIHCDCEGVGAETVWRPPKVFAPVRVLLRDIQIAIHYLQCVKGGFRIILILLIPVKLVTALLFHLRRGVALLMNKSYS